MILIRSSISPAILSVIINRYYRCVIAVRSLNRKCAFINVASSGRLVIKGVKYIFFIIPFRNGNDLYVLYVTAGWEVISRRIRNFGVRNAFPSIYSV